MTFALLYCRDDARGDGVPSLEAQEEALVADARRRGFEYKVVRERKRPTADASTDRLAEALDLLDQHHADVLMAVRLDRFADAEGGAESVLRRASARGWGLIVAGEPLGPGAVSPRFQEHLDELEATRQRSERTRAGIRRRRLEGAVFGKTVDPAFLPTYRRVLAMAADDVSINEIARRLNAEGVPAARGGIWYPSTVRAVLTSDTAKKLA